TGTPETETPETGTPEIETPETGTPEIETPETEAPEPKKIKSAKIKNIRTTKTGSTRVKLTWEANKSTSYCRIYRMEKDEKRFKMMGESEKKCSFVDENIKNGKQYTYRLVPVYEDENGTPFKGEEKKVTFQNTAIVGTGHQWYTYEEMRNDVRELERKYSEYCQSFVIGMSEDNREIYGVELGNPDAKKHLFVVSNLHAREYMTAQLCAKQMEYYLESYHDTIAGKKVKDLLEEISIVYIPMANPDGTTISQLGISAIKNGELRKKLNQMPGSKTPTRWKANARGVDLNRNYAKGFGYDSAKYPEGSGFSGKTPGSEKETKAILRLLKKYSENGEKIVAIVNYHAMGSIIYGESSATDTSTVKGNTKRMFDLAKKLTGYTKAYSNSASPDDGSFRTYHMKVLKIPGITLEIGRTPCPLPSSAFYDIWRRNKDVVIREAQLFCGV
ncbi:MAG: M14 family zinc carboxypeptidase, partial [Acetivibrio sp.]